MKYLFFGLGLIGGSVAKALQNTGTAAESIFYFDPAVKIPHFTKLNNFNHPWSFDVVVISTPLGVYNDVFEVINKHKNYQLKLVTDVGSVKALYNDRLSSVFVPAHPIAGKEIGGYNNAEANLFIDKKIIITPKASSQQSLDLAVSFWAKINQNKQNIIQMSPDQHNLIYAYISHLPQFLSFALASFTNISTLPPQFTRLCNSPQNIWKDIFRLNKKSLLIAINEFCNELLQPQYQNHVGIENLAIAISKALSNICTKYVAYCGSGYKSLTSLSHLHKLPSNQLDVTAEKFTKHLLAITTSLN